MSKLVIFDVDGTILDSYGLYEKVVEIYSREQGLPQPCIRTIKEGYGAPREHDFKWGVSREEQLRHLYATFQITDDWSVSGEADKTPGLFHGVEETLTHFKDLGHTLAIVTSKPEKPLLHLLEYHGIEKLFSAQRNWDDIARRGEREKPCPDKVQSIMRDLKFAPEETVMIGDTTMDVRAGLSAGASAIGVTWGTHTFDQLAGAGARHIIDTRFADLVPVVKKIFE